jgi:O-antigen biosynthesis protein WbqL
MPTLASALTETRLLDIGRAKAAAMVRLAPGHESPARLSYLWQDIPDEILTTDAIKSFCPPLDLFAFPKVELRSDWMPYLNDRVIWTTDIYPSYVRDFYSNGNIRAYGYPDTKKVRPVKHPTFVISHFNMRTYGHFLLEVLPKLMLIKELYASGLRYPIAFPASQPTFLGIVRAAFPEAKLLIYNDRKERLGLKLALLPSLPISSGAHLHELAAAAVKLLRLRHGGAQDHPRKIFISRKGYSSYRVLSNEEDLAEIAQRYGFAVVSPQDLAWSEQIAMFANATHVVGEFTSALHNTLFCPPTAQVVCFNWMGATQSAIAAAAGHSIGYLMPEHGARPAFVPNWKEPSLFSISPAEFEARLQQIGLAPV